MASRPQVPAVRILSLFSGGGGLDLGIEQATQGRARAVVYVEREAYAAASLVARMAEATLAEAPVWDDVCTFNARAWRGAVDLVVGGSPCQDISIAGKKAGLKGERSGLFFQYLRIADESGAAGLFWENVGGAAGGTLRSVFDAFESKGFRGAAVSIRASDVGAPQRRERIFVLAYRDDTGRALVRSLYDDCRGFAHGDDAARRDEGMGDAGRESDQLRRDAGVVSGEIGATRVAGNKTTRREPRSGGKVVARAARERDDGRVRGASRSSDGRSQLEHSAGSRSEGQGGRRLQPQQLESRRDAVADAASVGPGEGRPESIVEGETSAHRASQAGAR